MAPDHPTTGERILAVIPAKGTSRRFPRKNLALLRGQPLIAWTIRAARESGVCDRIVVSTDDSEIAQVALDLGAEAPFRRPPELSLDHVPNQRAIDHAVTWLQTREGYLPTAVMVLQPTSPLREASDLQAAAAALRPSVDHVASVNREEYSLHLLRQLDNSGAISAWRAAEPAAVNATTRPALFRLNGAIYLDRLHPSKDDTHAIVMPPERSIDIDSPWDLALAEAILQIRNS